MTPVVVIGAGLAGLSAACYLTGRGYDVTVVERELQPGGRAGVLHRDGFTFDTGPTVLTMPDLITDAIRAATGDSSAGLRDVHRMQARPAYRACLPTAARLRSVLLPGFRPAVTTAPAGPVYRPQSPSGFGDLGRRKRYSYLVTRNR